MTEGAEKPRITDSIREVPANWTHWEIYNSFHPQDPNSASVAAAEYQKLADTWSGAVEVFAARIRHSSSAAWEGNAAEASRTAITNYTTRALELTTPLTTLAGLVVSTVSSIVNTKSGVDKPIDAVAAYDPRGWDFGPLGEGSRSLDKINNSRDEAREAMQNHYVRGFSDADGKVPTLPNPVSPTDPLYTYNPEDKKTGGGGSPGTNPSTNPSGAQTTPSTTETPVTTQNPSTTTAEDDTTTDDDSDDDTTTTTPQTTNPTTPDTTQTTPSNTNPAGTNPAGTGSPGSGSPGSGSPGSGSPSSPGGPGKSIPGGGTPNAAVAATGAAGSGSGAQGRSGMPGMGGMGGGRGKDDESTHEIPEWLKNMKNTEELLGETPKSLPGGVIGGDG